MNMRKIYPLGLPVISSLLCCFVLNGFGAAYADAEKDNKQESAKEVEESLGDVVDAAKLISSPSSSSSETGETSESGEKKFDIRDGATKEMDKDASTENTVGGPANKSAYDVTSESHANVPLNPIVSKTTKAQTKSSAKMATDDTLIDPADLDPQLHYQQALELMQRHLWGQATAELRRALELNPRYYDAVNKLALIYQLTGHEDAAITKYKKLLYYRPDFIDAHINLGSLLAKKADVIGAETEYRKALSLNFYSFQAHFNLANLYAAHERDKEALAEYKHCLSLVGAMSDQAALVHNNIGAVYEQKHYLQEAAAEFKKAWEIAPANKTYQTNIELVQKLIKEGPKDKLM